MSSQVVSLELCLAPCKFFLPVNLIRQTQRNKRNKVQNRKQIKVYENLVYDTVLCKLMREGLHSGEIC